MIKTFLKQIMVLVSLTALSAQTNIMILIRDITYLEPKSYMFVWSVYASNALPLLQRSSLIKKHNISKGLKMSRQLHSLFQNLSSLLKLKRREYHRIKVKFFRICILSIFWARDTSVKTEVYLLMIRWKFFTRAALRKE